MELNQYEIGYLLRATIKGQVVVEFITKLTLKKELKDLLKPVANAEGPSQSLQPITMTWTLHVDGSLNDNGNGAGLIFGFPELECLQIECVWRLRFKTSNNKVKYMKHTLQD